MIAVQLDDIEETIRESELQEGPVVCEEVMAIAIGIRDEFGLGRSLQNACPYFRRCDVKGKSPKFCVGTERYRAHLCYKTKLKQESLLAGISD